MNLPEADNPFVKYLLLLGLGYLTVSSCLWQFSYWSSFNINIFPLLDLPTVLLSFAKQLAILFGIGIVTIMTSGIHFLRKANNESSDQKNSIDGGDHQLSIRFANIIFFACLFVCYLMLRAAYKWPLFWVIMPIFFSLVVSFRIMILEKISILLPNKIARFVFCCVFIILPACFFASAKYDALLIYDDNHKINLVKIAIRQSNLGDGSLSEPQKYKMIGETKDFVFVMTLDNRSILQIPFDNIDIMEFDMTPDTAHFRKRNRPENIIRRSIDD